jgi:hypothetical protein
MNSVSSISSSRFDGLRQPSAAGRREISEYCFSLDRAYRDRPELAAISAVLGVVPKQENTFVAGSGHSLEDQARRFARVRGGNNVA